MNAIKWFFIYLLMPSAIALGVLYLGVPVALVVASSDQASGPNPDCTTGPDLRIKVGTTVLSIPRRYSPIIFDTAGNTVGSAKKICQLPDDPAIYAGGVTFNFSGHPHNKQAEDPLTLPIWRVQVEIDMPAQHTTPEREYERQIAFMERHGNRLSDLDSHHGFLVFDGFANDRRTYIAEPGTVESLDPHPLVVVCSTPIPSSASSRIDYGRPCKTPYYRLTDSVVGLYKFYEGVTPLAEFAELDAAVRAFVRSLVSASEQQSEHCCMLPRKTKADEPGMKSKEARSLS